MRRRPYGPRAVLVEIDADRRPADVASRWRAAAWPGVVDVVPAAATVLVVHDGTFREELLDLPLPDWRGEREVTAPVVVDVVYDGADLDTVAASVGVSVEAVVEMHSGADHRVEFCGFMPGFPYLSGLPESLHLPRRATPRDRVAAGSVAIAAGYTGIYPQESPGGWHLLGRCKAVLWDAERTVPALLPPGTDVRFRAVAR